MRGKKLVAVVLGMMLVFMAGCGKSESLTGKWMYEDDENSETIEFFSDGTGIMQGIKDDGEEYKYDCTWIAENGRIKITLNMGILGDHSVAYDYKLDSTALTLISEDGDEGVYNKQ